MRHSRFLAFGVVSLFVAQLWAAQPRPNIIFLLADDLGYGDIGAFGQTKIRTPNLDRLATEGMKLTQHYAGHNVCAPSRCVLMSGKHPGHAYVRDNRGGVGVAGGTAEGQEPVPAGELQLPLTFNDRKAQSLTLFVWPDPFRLALRWCLAQSRQEATN